MDRYKDFLGYIEGVIPSSTNRVEFSLRGLFGELPVDPKVFNKLDPRLKWFGKCEESKSFCVGCGTLTPEIPYSHHKNCSHYLSEEYCQELEADKVKCLGTQKQRSKPLKVELNKGQLLISIGIDTLVHAVTMVDCWDEDVKITDSYEFARGIVTEITDDNESVGTVYHMLDKAAEKAVGQGSLGIEIEEN